MDMANVEELKFQIAQLKCMIQQGQINQYNAYLRSEDFIYRDCACMLDVFRAVLNEDIDELNRIKTRKYGVFNESDENGNTPLHVAVIKNKLKSVDYLLNQYEVSVNAKNCIGQSPLFNAVRCDKLIIIKRLIEEKANINTMDFLGNTPLHVAVSYPHIAYILLKSGAKMDVVNFDLDTPLHNAVTMENLETFCMLLYFNCDTSVKNINGRTPFMDALIYENKEMQSILLEYTDDFNASNSDGDTILKLALIYQSPFVEEILLRGAKVNYNALEASLMKNNHKIFKTIWKRLPCEELKKSNLLDKLAYGSEKNNISKCIDIILENSDSNLLDSLANCFSCQLSFTDFIEKCAYRHCLEQLTKFTCVLLEHNCEFFLSTVFEIYVYFGYCDLFKYFLYVDQIVDNLKSNCSLGWIIPRYIYNITSDTECIFQESSYDLPLDEVHLHRAIRSLEFSTNASLINLLKKHLHSDKKYYQMCENLSTVPSLLELAREGTKKYIVSKFNFSTPSQYYTYINSMDINNTYKKILCLEKSINKLNFD